MKNKKILNICLLTFALISLITFILPIKKFEALLGGSTAINIVFYVCSAILIISVSAIIVFAIINLSKKADKQNFESYDSENKKENLEENKNDSEEKNA